METPQNEAGTLAARYKALSFVRQGYLTTARRCSELTIPYLIPPEGMSHGAVLPTPYQGIGAQGVQNLASKLLLALLPPNSPLFRLAVDQFELNKIATDPRVLTELDTVLSEIEAAVTSELEVSGTRVSTFEALLHLIVGGNVLLNRQKGKTRTYHLDRYVVERDPEGNLLTVILHESIAPSALPQKLRGLAQKEEGKTTLDLFTVVERSRNGKRWDTWQELCGVEVPDSRGWYRIDRNPYMPLRFFRVDGEPYGRSFVEHYLGDLVSLEGLSQAVLEGSVAAAKILFLVAPNGTTNIKKLSEARNGDFVQGIPEEVKALQMEKFYDFRTAETQADKIEKRLQTAFLLLTGVQRNAERVTAEEIRALVQELETGLGGVYSILAQEFQLPLVTATMDEMASEGRLPKLPKKIVKPTVITGIEALGRGNDLQRLDAFLQGVMEKFGPEVVATYVNADEYLARRAAALSVNAKGLIKTREEVQQMQQAAQQQTAMQGLVEKLGPEALRQGGQMLQQNQPV
jgi:hypothetical protein